MSTRKSARVASKPKVTKPDPEDDVSGEEEEEEEIKQKKTTKKSPAKTPKKAAKGKRKAEDVEDEEEDDGESSESSKKAKKSGGAPQDTTNATTTIAKSLEEAKGSKTLKEILTIVPDSSSSSSTTVTTSINPVDGSVATSISSWKELSSESFEVHFDKIADALLNKSVLFIGGQPHRVLELEFYCNGCKHADLFAHGHERQKKRAEWYFHMTGKGYKGGSYKGLDVTFGDEDFYGGILLRTIQPLYGDFQPVEGPSLLVDRVLELTKSSTVENLVSKFDMTAELADSSKTDHPLFFVYSDTDKIDAYQKSPVYKGARVGLSMKTFVDTKETYVGKFYRYMVTPDKIKKGRNYLVSSLHQQGKTAKEIVELTKSTASSVDKLIKLFTDASTKDFKPYCFKNLKNDEVCQMLGACSTYAYPKK